MAVRAYSQCALLLLLATSACDKGDAGRNDRQPPPGPPPGAPASGVPPSASAPGPAADVCAAGGGVDTDPVSAPLIPRAVAHYCLDPQSEPKTYGAQGKLSMDEVCTTAFDGECEVYKRFGLDRVVVLRYVDGTGAPNSVEVNLSRFSTSDGAYAMFTKRVVADGDPAAATVKPAAFGAVGGDEQQQRVRVARVVPRRADLRDRGHEDDARGDGRAERRWRRARSPPRSGRRLPGPTDLPPAAAALPPAMRMPLGIAYHPKEALGVSGVGPAAVGYYK